MEYVIFDLEWNQARYCGAKVRKTLNKFSFRLIGEIIQIGAVKLDARGNIIDDFKIGVKPQFFSIMNRNVKELTGISQEMLALGMDFPEAINRFKTWCGSDVKFLSWGQDDIVVLMQNLELYGLNDNLFTNFFDLQKIFGLQIKNVTKKQIALIKAVEYFAIDQSRAAHDALNDAYYAAYVAQKLDLVKGIVEAGQFSKNDIFSRAECVKKQAFFNIKVKIEAFRKLKITRSDCICCEKRMQNKKVVKINKNEYVLLSSCKQDGIFFVRVRFIKDYCGALTARKEIYKINQELTDFYDKKLSDKMIKKLLSRSYLLQADNALAAESL